MIDNWAGTEVEPVTLDTSTKQVILDFEMLSNSVFDPNKVTLMLSVNTSQL